MPAAEVADMYLSFFLLAIRPSWLWKQQDNNRIDNNRIVMMKTLSNTIGVKNAFFFAKKSSSFAYGVATAGVGWERAGGWASVCDPSDICKYKPHISTNVSLFELQIVVVVLVGKKLLSSSRTNNTTYVESSSPGSRLCPIVSVRTGCTFHLLKKALIITSVKSGSNLYPS